jgi:hypothetical protein
MYSFSFAYNDVLPFHCRRCLEIRSRLVDSKPGDTTVRILCKEGKQTESTLQLATVGVGSQCEGLAMCQCGAVPWPSALGRQPAGAAAAVGRWSGEVGGRALKWGPKTGMKDGRIGCQTSCSIDIDSGSYVRAVLKETNSSSFRDFVIAVTFHNKNLGILYQVRTSSVDGS